MFFLKSSTKVSSVIAVFVALVTSMVLFSSDALADSKAEKKKAKAFIKQHKELLKKVKKLKLSPAAFASVSGAGTLTDSDLDGVPDLYEEAKTAFNSCDTDSDDDEIEDGDESSSSSSSSSSGGSSSSSSGGSSSSSSSSSSSGGSSSSSGS